MSFLHVATIFIHELLPSCNINTKTSSNYIESKERLPHAPKFICNTRKLQFCRNTASTFYASTQVESSHTHIVYKWRNNKDKFKQESLKPLLVKKLDKRSITKLPKGNKKPEGRKTRGRFLGKRKFKMVAKYI